MVPPNYKLVYNPNNYRYIPLINPSEIVLINQLNANYAAPPCTSIHPYIHTYIHPYMLTYKRTLKNWWYTSGGCLPTGFEEGIAEAFNNAFEDARWWRVKKVACCLGLSTKTRYTSTCMKIDMCISFYILKNSLQSTISWTMAGMINNQQKTYIHTCVCIYIYIYTIWTLGVFDKRCQKPSTWHSIWENPWKKQMASGMRKLFLRFHSKAEAIKIRPCLMELACTTTEHDDSHSSEKGVHHYIQIHVCTTLRI